MNLTISKMTLDDFNLISTILTSEFDDFWNSNILKQELENTSCFYLVAKYKNEIVGFSGVNIVLDNADLMNIIVKKNYRNKGIGTILLKELINYCKKQNLKTFTLEVNVTNLIAIMLYENFGFKKIGIRKNYYNNDSAIIMQKDLLI